MPTDERTRGKPRPKWLRALGDAEPPERITLGDGRECERLEVLKSDSWAATAVYQSQTGKVIAKFNRQQPVFIIPMKWLGHRLARRESGVLRLLADVPGIVPDCGTVSAGGKVLRYACAHDYIEGHPLAEGERPDDDFFPSLKQTLAQLHDRDVAYVDLNKRDNIIVAEDGRPWLIDFQIHYRLPRWIPARWIGRPLLRTLQRADEYHLLKHHIRHRRDQLTDAEADLDRLRPVAIRMWRKISTPFQRARRRLLVALGVRTGKGSARTEHEPMEALRNEQADHPPMS